LKLDFNWTTINREEIKLPHEELEEMLDSLIVSNLLIGFEVNFSMLEASNDIRFSIDFVINDTRINVMIIERENQFNYISFSLFSRMDSLSYQKVYDKCGIHSRARTNEEIIELLLNVDKILNIVHKCK
jgi:hypothetical protein